MKEDIKETSIFFGISIVLWLISEAIENPIFVWLLKYGLKFGTILFALGGIVAIINAVVSYRNKNKDNDNNNPQLT